MKKNYSINLIPDYKTDISPIKVIFDDDSTIYDFSIFQDTKVVRAFAQAFYNRYAQYSKNARNPAFNHLKIFFNFFNVNYTHDFNVFTSKLLISFATWLDSNDKYSLKTKYRYYNNLEIFLKEIIKITDSPLKNFDLPSSPFRNVHSEAKEKNKLNDEQIHRILRVCYQKIDDSLASFRFGKKIIEEYNPSIAIPFKSKKIEDIAPYFYHKYGYLPTVDYPYMTNQEARWVSESGGAKTISKYIHPTTEDLLPFYLVLLIELVGNSDAVKNIKIDCIHDDLIFQDRADIIWDKPRANKPQKRNVLKNKKYGAYQIIEMVKEYTSLIRNKLSGTEHEMLFIARGNVNSNPIMVAQEHTFRYELKSFIEENLDFSFKLMDLRPSILTSFYKKRKDIVATSKIANHSNVNTTLSYIVDKEVKKENLTYLSHKQEQVIDKLINHNSLEISSKIKNENNEVLSSNIGFSCKKPISENKVCINWMAELTNPNLVIPDNATYLAKILKLSESIKKQKSYINSEKYELLYAPVINTIEEHILPKFNKKTITKAKSIAKDVFIPSLEGY